MPPPHVPSSDQDETTTRRSQARTPAPQLLPQPAVDRFTALSVGGSRFDGSRAGVRRVIAVLSRVGPAVGLSAHFCRSGNALRLLRGALQTRRGSVSRRDRPSPGEVNPVRDRAGLHRCVGRNASSRRLHDICQQPGGPRAVAPVEAAGMEAAAPRNGIAQDSDRWRGSDRSLHRSGTAQRSSPPRNRLRLRGRRTASFPGGTGANRRPGLARSRRIH